MTVWSLDKLTGDLHMYIARYLATGAVALSSLAWTAPALATDEEPGNSSVSRQRHRQARQDDRQMYLDTAREGRQDFRDRKHAAQDEFRRTKHDARDDARSRRDAARTEFEAETHEAWTELQTLHKSLAIDARDASSITLV